MKLGIIILSWNSGDRIIDCLDSIFKFYEKPNIYVVDNNSRDKTLNLLENYPERINIIKSKSNLGFASGNNLGFRYAKKDNCEYVLLLNDDVIILEDFITPILNEMDLDHKIGSSGPIIVEDYDRSIVQCAGGHINKITLDMKYLERGNKFKKKNKSDFVDYILGASIFIRTNLFEDDQLFDPHFYPAYVEEVDLCYRIKMKGFNNKIFYNYKIAHIGSLSASNKSLTYRRILMNKILFSIKHFSLLRTFFHINVLLLKYFLKLIIGKIEKV
tara:strand:- start:315 stop:1130 length:816 start_codon:yes stop_codon:yes gene_type:complete